MAFACYKTMDQDRLWQSALGELELLISKANFTTWFKNTFVHSIDGGKVVVGVPNGFTKAWLETKYHPAIQKALSNATGQPVAAVEYRVEARTRSPQPRTELVAATPPPPHVQPLERATVSANVSEKNNLNTKYTFDTFIVGKGSELAYAAAKAVADQPGAVYNPLFLYGGVGLGKTHLMQAIGNEILAKDKQKKVLYVSSERFTNEFIQAVSHGNAEKFKNFYRTVDALLIDDIQFLAGKEGTQEEFFHTFNTLHQNKKQIVVTSDRPPKSIAALEARLVSRFEWGMIADIAQPDLETRIAILSAKCREKSYPLSDEIVQAIATTVQSNVRELEGALNRIIAFHSLNQTAPSLESVRPLLGALSQNQKRGGVTPKQVVAAVAQFYDISLEDIIGTSRKKELVEPRQMAMYVLREELHSSFPAIGQELGGRDHTTAMHACTKIAHQIETDEKTKQDLVLIKQRLYGG